MKPAPLLLAAIICLLLTGAQARTWTSADRSRTFDGQLISYNPDTGLVGVKLANGTSVEFSTKVLSEADITFLRKQGMVVAPFSRFVRPSANGKLQYAPDENGDTIPDFSYCGYMGGEVPLPDAPVRIAIEPADGDDGPQIQAALDQVGKLTPDSRGMRGAVLLKHGTYQIAGSLDINQSGVVLRGEGDNESGTILVATGKSPRNFIRISVQEGPKEIKNTRCKIVDARVPVGARSIRAGRTSDFKVGDRIFVIRHGNKEWISAIGMDQIMARPGNPDRTKQWGPFSLVFERKIIRIVGDQITVDAPIVCAIEARWGGGEITKYSEEKRVQNCGVENLRMVSEYDPALKKGGYFVDEAHATNAITISHAADCWVRNVTARHFVYSCVSIASSSRHITVQDSRCEAMVSQIAGGRRYSFNVNGQMCLVQRCTAESARHAFVFGARVPGPNVFLDCKSTNEFGYSEPHHRWSVGGLYDNIEGNIAIQDRQYLGSGHGWAGANYVAWNCRGTLVCQSPPTAQNWAIGFVGKINQGSFKGKQDGLWDSHGKPVEPRSLYEAQLQDRLGTSAVEAISRN
jgi:hypothetical protein